MNYEKAQSIEDVASRVQVLVIVVVILAVVLLVFMVVECALLTYSLYKKRGAIDTKLDSIVVKDKKKKPSSSKSVGSSKKRPVKPKQAKKKKSSRSSKASSKTSKSSAVGLDSQTKKKLSSKKDSSKKDVKQKSQNSSAKQHKKPAAQSKTDAQLKTASEGNSKFDTTSLGTNTITQIAHIPPQFPPKKFSKKQRDGDTTTASQIADLPSQFHGLSTIRDRDMTTEQQIAAIPPQFEDPKTARSARDDVVLSSDQLREIAAQVLANLALAQPATQVPATNDNLQPPAPSQAPQQAPAQVLSQPPPEVPLPKPVVQQPIVTPVYTAKGPADSLYLMDVGQNGETLNVISPNKEVATNSLIINAQNAASNDPSKKDVATAKSSNP